MKDYFKKLGRFVLGGLYLAIPVIGWYAFAKSIKRVNPGEIALINNVSGSFEVIEEGLYFRPFPGDKFSKNFRKSDDYIDMGPVKRVRVKEGEQAVVNNNGIYQALNPGIHYIDSTKNQTFNKDTDLQKINQLEYRLGAKQFITIKNGDLGESYKDGQFVLLEPGKHALPPNHIYTKKVSVANDVVDLGALKIVTVKEGQVALINGPEGNILKGPGKHYIRQEEGYFFDRLITVNPQVLSLAPLTVMCSDKIEMRAEAVLLYEIKEPLKTVGSGVQSVIRDLKEYAEGTLRSILRRFSSSDIALSLHQDENHSSHDREKKLKSLHDDFVAQLDGRANGWGIKIADLQFTHILPADENYHSTIRDLGVRQSTADANKALAETEATIANIKAAAEVSKVTAAKIEQDEALVRAETDAKTKTIHANAEYNQKMQRSKAQAEGIKLIAEAEFERLNKLGKAADGLKSDTAKQLALLDKQKEIFTTVENPILIQPQLGQTSVWHNKGNRSTFFTTQSQKNDGHSSVVDYLALESAKRTQDIVRPRN